MLVALDIDTRVPLVVDLDGTLTDPKEGIIRSVCYAIEKMGMQPPAPESLEWMIGPPLQGGLAMILRTDDPEVSAECLRHYRERFSDTGLFENFVYPGVPDMLESLHGLGMKLYVATSKPALYAERILEHFGSRFGDQIWTASAKLGPTA